MAGVILLVIIGRLTVASDGDAAGRAVNQAHAERADPLGWSVTLLPALEGQN
jgi:hypothetical protein